MSDTNHVSFHPIAIVGQGCVLPGALSPAQLHQAIFEGKSLLSHAPKDRWGIKSRAPRTSKAGAPDFPWSDRGGYVQGFQEVFTPGSTALPAELVSSLDPLFQWVLYAAGQALRDAGIEGQQERAGAIFGNLGFPSASQAQFATSVLLSAQGGEMAKRAPQRPAPQNRFMSGLPAHLLAKAYGLGAGAFALDAACASALYAIKLACDKLADKEADLMLAGAINCCDDLFIHTGFCALQALSKSGNSRPFSTHADGLLPAEGAVFFALKRLEDAVANHDQIYGVIRGVGLSNDGRSSGILVPTVEGQVRAMEAAYRQSGWSPSSVGMVECHATGTQVGDRVELESMRKVFAGVAMPIGSIKSNMGHPITAAGGVSLLKVLGGMQRGMKPPMLEVDSPLPFLTETPFRLITKAEQWEGQQRAAINAFGFGGNNAHLLVESYDERASTSSARPMKSDPIVAVGMAARVGDLKTDAFIRAVVERQQVAKEEGAKATHVHVDLKGLKFPPKDLSQAHPQQLMILEVAREVADAVGELPRNKTGVFIGMGTDPEIGRYRVRWSLPEWSEDESWVERAMNATVPHLEVAGVVGTMPNIVANRINSQLDVAGPSFSTSSEEASGLRALQIAMRALRAHELDAAIVGAVDLSCEPIHQEAARHVLPPGQQRPADAAVAIVLMRREDARRRGLSVLGVIDGEGHGVNLGECGDNIELQLGHAHAASGLIHLAAGLAMTSHHVRPNQKTPTPWLQRDARGVSIAVPTLEAQTSRANVSIDTEEPGRAYVPIDPPQVWRWQASNRAELLQVMQSAPQGEPTPPPYGSARRHSLEGGDPSGSSQMDPRFRGNDGREHGNEGRKSGDNGALRLAQGTAQSTGDVSQLILKEGCSEVLDPKKDTWLNDHQPTYGAPVLPMMSMVERVAAAAPRGDKRVIGLRNFQVKRWVPIQGPVQLKTTQEGNVITLWADDNGEFRPAASGEVILGDEYPAPPENLPALGESTEGENPYEAGALFHGPSFQLSKRLRFGATGSSSVLDAGINQAPIGLLHQVLLDGITHGIPHDQLWRWSDQIPKDRVAYPAFLPEINFYQAPPTEGEVRCEVRFDGFVNSPRFPAFRAQVITENGIYCDLRLVEALFPLGPLGAAPTQKRLAFLRDKRYVPDLSLSRYDAATKRTRLSPMEVQGSDWMPGTIARLYQAIPAEGDRNGLLSLTKQVAIKEHIARRLQVHPSKIQTTGDNSGASEEKPSIHYPVKLSIEGADIIVEDDGEPTHQEPVTLAIAAPLSQLPALRDSVSAMLREGRTPKAEGVSFNEKPIGGSVALAFDSAGGAYAEMGRSLLLAFPELVPSIQCDWLYSDKEASSPLEYLWGASTICQTHAGLTKHLGISAEIVFGLSSGESNALFAAGVWSDLDSLRADAATSGLFDTHLGGPLEAVAKAWGETPDWEVLHVRAPLAEVERALAELTRAYLTIIHTEDDVVVAGSLRSMQRFREIIGSNRVNTIQYRLAAHVPELEVVAKEWEELHSRESNAVTSPKVYSAASGEPYHPTREAAAKALLEQAVTTVDLRKVVRRVYQDGARVFITCGPRSSLASWISRDLEGSEHLVVALDRFGVDPLLSAARAIAQLAAAGVSVDIDAFNARLRPSIKSEETRPLTLPAHWAPVKIPPLPTHVKEASVAQSETNHFQKMAPAPWLPPVLSSNKEANPSAEATAPTPPKAIVVAPPNTTIVNEPAAAPSGVIAQLMAQQKRLTEAHQKYLRDQQQLHQQFIGAHQGAMKNLAAYLHQKGQAPTIKPAPIVAPSSLRHSSGSAPSSPTSLRHPPASETRPKEPSSAPSSHGEGESLAGTSRRPKDLSYASSSSGEATPRPGDPSETKNQMAPRLHGDDGKKQMRPTPPALRIAPNAFPFPAHKPVPDMDTLPGPKLDRLDLELHSSGPISKIYGEQFQAQDVYARQCRMPEPPLLLADRVLGIDAKPGVLGTGTMWTQTDITEESWFVRDDGYMPPGLMIESGQADLMLISWMGIDFLNNKDQRLYRLLGCDLTYRGSLPKTGDTMTYEISIDGHANQGPIRLFFFHYDCTVDGRPALCVRNGQAGFFTEKELEESGGVLWDAEGAEHDPTMRLDAPKVMCQHDSFTKEQLLHFAAGDGFSCFGRGFEKLSTHTRTPKIQGPPMLFLDRVSHFDPKGGPWRRGYMRVELDISADRWFFDGHFKNDPCMPGTLMLEGCLQAMSLYLAALGYTLDRDGWRFEPVPEHTVPLRCRGQTVPTSKLLVCELFIESVEDGPHPTIYADLLGTQDGLKSFYARRMGFRLVPDWPLETSVPELARYVEPEPVAQIDGFKFDYRSLLACAWGRPSEAFGPGYSRFDGGVKVARLPGAPYHFMSRVTDIKGKLFGMEVGSEVELAWDIPQDAWYFDSNNCRVMPFCVLLEAALQPCGWLASFVGSALTVDKELYFRNLDGDGEILAELVPTSGTLRTRVKITQISQSAGMIIEGFDVLCLLGDVEVYRLKTVFGFFPEEALAQQKGVPTKESDLARINAPSEHRVELRRDLPERFFGGGLRLPQNPQLMLDRITGYWPKEGGLGRMRGEKDVVASDWFFKSHFYQDPVQPGSLGLDALIQLTQAYVIESGIASEMRAPRFESIGTAARHQWKYRGQIVPTRKKITSEIEVKEIIRDEKGILLIAEGYLWCDGLCIYHFVRLPVRVVEGAPPAGQQAPRAKRGAAIDGSFVPSGAISTPGNIVELMPPQTAPQARLANFYEQHARRHQLTKQWGGRVTQVMSSDRASTSREMKSHAHIPFAERQKDTFLTDVARKSGALLSEIRVEGDEARVPFLPLTRFVREGDHAREALDLTPAKKFWSGFFGIDWPVEELNYTIAERYLRRVIVEDPAATAALHGKSAVYLANHQVALESLLFTTAIGGMMGLPNVTVAKAEHEHTWMGALNELCFSWPGAKDPGSLVFFNREDQASLRDLLVDVFTKVSRNERSALVHIEGTRSLQCTTRVEKIGGTVLDGAIATGAPIVPVRFIGGLPRTTLTARLDFPLGYGSQDIWIGRPIPAERLAALPLKERKALVVNAINDLGMPNTAEHPNPPQPKMEAQINHWIERTRAEPAWAAIFEALRQSERHHAVTDAIIEGAKTGVLRAPETPEGQWMKRLARLFYGARGPIMIK